jgi:succinoglycan biosynthesis protein ExoA
MDTISVIIPAESVCSGAPVLDYLKKVDYPQENIEIIMSIGNRPSAQRNQAAGLAKGDILYFFNRNVQLQPDLFKKMLSIINRETKIAGVGGVDITPEGNSYIQQLFGYAMGSYFAHWKMRARYVQVGKEKVACENELLLSNMAIKRSIFLASGGFNEGLYPNEENELINRISKKGYEFIYSPDIKIYRDRRKDIFKFMRQFYSYGQGRLGQMNIEGVFRNFQFLIPLIFLLYVASLLFINNSRIVFIPLIVYIVLAVADSIYLSFKNKKNLIILPVIYLMMHFSYACGMISGICANMTKKKTALTPKVNYKIVYIQEITR